jgi:hypothetical protein
MDNSGVGNSLSLATLGQRYGTTPVIYFLFTIHALVPPPAVHLT